MSSLLLKPRQIVFFKAAVRAADRPAFQPGKNLRIRAQAPGQFAPAQHNSDEFAQLFDGEHATEILLTIGNVGAQAKIDVAGRIGNENRPLTVHLDEQQHLVEGTASTIGR
jgi:hypothetical protein